MDSDVEEKPLILNNFHNTIGSDQNSVTISNNNVDDGTFLREHFTTFRSSQMEFENSRTSELRIESVGFDGKIPSSVV